MVLESAHCLMNQLRATGHGPFSHLEILALYVAAIGHDAGHFGLNNAYLKNAGRGLHSFTSQLNLSRFGHTSPCPPV